MKAIQDHFLTTKNQQKFHVATYTTNVALLINGTTIHSLLGFSIDKHTINQTQRNHQCMAQYPIHHY